MKNRSAFLIILLFVITYITTFYSNKILKPFYYLKDLVFYPVHAIDNEISLSDELEESVINNLKIDLEELKKLTNITLSITDFDMINATVISRNRDYWYNNITINKGTRDNIELDMAVIDSNGLIGRISSVTKNTSLVKLITTNDTKNKISAVIHDKEDIYGIISGYDSEENLLNMIITNNEKIKEGSTVETTGMGGVFPRGILIGKVYDVIKKEDGVTNVIRIIPSSNIEGERYVTVLSRKKVSNN